MSTDSILDVVMVLGAYTALVLVLMVAWAIVSPVAFALRFVLGRMKFQQTTTSLIKWLVTVKPVGLWLAGWSLTAGFMPAKGQELRLVVEDRLASVQKSQKAFAEQLRSSSNMLQGLEGSDGPSGLAKEMRDLRDDILRLGNDETPYDIADGYEEASAKDLKVRQAYVVISILGVLVALVNGVILSEAFRGLGFTQVLAGVMSVGLGLAMIYVVMEAGVGFLLHLCLASESDTGGWVLKVLGALLVLVALALVLVEVSITNLIGASRMGNPDGVTASLANLLALENLSFLGIMGFAIGTFNILAGFMYHVVSDQKAHFAARQEIVKDAKAWNDLLASLPTRLGKIANDLNRAQGAIGAYLDTVSSKGDSITGAVEAVGRERRSYTKALENADLRNWPQWIGTDEGDTLQNFWLSIGIALLTLIVGGVFVVTFGYEVDSAMAAAPAALAIGGALGSAVGFYALGFFFLSKVQLIEHPHNATMPLQTRDPEKILLLMVMISSVLAVWGFSFYAHGWSGFALGALNSFLAIILILQGSQWDRFLPGLLSAGIGLLTVFLALSAAIIGLVLHLFGWPILLTCNALLLALRFLALPLDYFLDVLDRWKSGPEARAT